jgi:hypothetical protein
MAYTGWSKSLCAPDDYNTELQVMFKVLLTCLQPFIDMPHHLAQSDCLAADRQGQVDTSY